MLSSRLFAVLLLASMMLYQASCLKQPQVTFLWSNTQLFTSDYTNDQFPATELSYLMDSVMGSQQKYAGLLNQDVQVSNLVLLIAPIGSSHQASRQLKNLVESSQSSLSLPYSYFSSISVSGVYSDVVLANGFSQVEDTLMDFSSQPFENKIIVLDLSDEDTTTTDDVLLRIAETFGQTKYVTMYTTKSVDAPISSLPYSARSYLSVDEDSSDSDVLCTGEPPNRICQDPPYHSYWPPYIIEGLATSFLLIFITVIGIYCTAQLQTPTQFETKEKRKESTLT